MSLVPKGYVNYKSTPIYDHETVPKMLLHRHNTKVGVYGQIQVLAGQLKFIGFSERRGEADKEVIIKENETAISHPQYWHKVELLTPDTRFIIHFYAREGSEIVMQSLSTRGQQKKQSREQ